MRAHRVTVIGAALVGGALLLVAHRPTAADEKPPKTFKEMVERLKALVIKSQGSHDDFIALADRAVGLDLSFKFDRKERKKHAARCAKKGIKTGDDLKKALACVPKGEGCDLFDYPDMADMIQVDEKKSTVTFSQAGPCAAQFTVGKGRDGASLLRAIQVIESDPSGGD